MKKTKPAFLDQEEKDLITAYEAVDTKKLKRPGKVRQDVFKAAAREWVRKEAKMNIRVSPSELDRIKEVASEEGLKYQTFVRSIIHKYVTGQLVDRQSI